MLCKLPFYCYLPEFAKTLQCTRGGYFMAHRMNDDMEVKHVMHTTFQ